LREAAEIASAAAMISLRRRSMPPRKIGAMILRSHCGPGTSRANVSGQTSITSTTKSASSRCASRAAASGPSSGGRLAMIRSGRSSCPDATDSVASRSNVRPKSRWLFSRASETFFS
jgi:hypothetical protein